MGTGAPVILVDGALCYRAFGPMPALASLLAPHFTVFMYDRRGRGASENGRPFTVEREIEDIEALINEAGGSAYVYGISSGAALALEAAAHGLNIKKLALYEPPFNNEAQRESMAYRTQLDQLLREDRRGDAVALFLSYVGMPPEAIAGMRQAPMWPQFEAVAPTLAYDGAVLGNGVVPVERAATITIPTLVMAGGATFPFMHDTAQRLEKAIPKAHYRVLPDQTHDVAADVMAPALIEFFQP
jgi:pimeloyl-ACP methyl ester carboxylesterase